MSSTAREAAVSAFVFVHCGVCPCAFSTAVSQERLKLLDLEPGLVAEHVAAAQLPPARPR